MGDQPFTETPRVLDDFRLDDVSGFREFGLQVFSSHVEEKIADVDSLAYFRHRSLGRNGSILWSGGRVGG